MTFDNEKEQSISKSLLKSLLNCYSPSTTQNRLRQGSYAKSCNVVEEFSKPSLLDQTKQKGISLKKKKKIFVVRFKTFYTYGPKAIDIRKIQIMIGIVQWQNISAGEQLL